MAHFAQLDENNVVTQVIVVHNNELAADTEVVIDGGVVKEKLVLSEEKGIQFLQKLYGENTRWAQTSYNNRFRGKYACIGYKFENGEFVEPASNVIQTSVLSVIGSSQTPALTTSDISSLG